MPVRIIFASVFVFLLISFNASKADEKFLRYAYIEFPPFTYTESNNKPGGFLVEWASKVFKRAGYRYQAESLPVMRLAGYITEGRTDVWIGLKTLPQFRGKTHKGEVKVTDLVLRVYTIGKKKKIIKKEDLKGVSVIILRGYSYGGWIKYIEDSVNKVRYIKANKHTYALNMLNAGRADYLLDYKAPCEIAQRTVKVKNLKYNTIKALPIYFIVSGKYNNGGRVLKDLEKAFKSLKREGKLKY